MSRLPRRLLLPAWLALAAIPISVTAPAAAGGGGWQWPLTPRPAVLGGFDAPTGPYAPGHRGVDLAARIGQPVLAPGAGTVAFAGQVAGRGVVSVAHADGRRTTYEPVAPDLPVGAVVDVGEQVGTVTAAAGGHCLPRTCLHWGLRVGETYVDPLTLLGPPRVRLLPMWAPLAATWWGVDPQSSVTAAPARVTAPAQVTAPAPVTTPQPDRGPLLAGLQQ